MRPGQSLTVLFSAFAWVWMFVVFMLCFFASFSVWLVTAPFDRGRYWAGFAGRKAGSLASLVNPLWTFSWAGPAPKDPRKPYVVVTNHESSADPFLLARLPFEMKYLSKKSLFKIPFFGWAMYFAGDIPVDRGDKSDRGAALARCAVVLRRKVSILIFPEGTRSRTAELLPFRHGPFRLAIECGVDVLPLGISGTRGVIPKGTWLLSPSRACVMIGDPVSTAGLTPDDAPVLAERVCVIVSRLRAEAAAKVAVDAASA